MADIVDEKVALLFEQYFEKLASNQQQQLQGVEEKLDRLCSNVEKLCNFGVISSAHDHHNGSTPVTPSQALAPELYFSGSDQGELREVSHAASLRSVASRMSGNEVVQAATRRLQRSGIFQRSRSKRVERVLQRCSWKDVCRLSWYHFEMLCGFVILINAVVIGMQANYVSTDDMYAQLTVAQHSVGVWFLVELVVRAYAFGLREWATSKQDKWWNFFDLCLVSLWLIELSLVVVSTNANFVRSLRIFRLCRVLRSLRIFRMVRQILEFRKMIHALYCSFSTLVWSIILLTFEIFFFAVVFVQAVIAMKEDGVIDDTADLVEHFGTMGRAYYTLYLCISNGITWNEVITPMFNSMHWIYAFTFLFYMSLTLFGVLNVVTAIFVESALESAAYHRDVMIANKTRARNHYVTHLREIFSEVDADNSGTITLDEMEAILMSPDINELLECLDITAFDAISLFRLLDQDRTSSIDIEEFCDGCLRLKGEAKSFDVHCLIHETQRSMKKLNDVGSKLALYLSTSPRYGCGREPGSVEKLIAGQFGAEDPSFRSPSERVPSAPECHPRKPVSKCFFPRDQGEVKETAIVVKS